ncbi:hypothetical protein Q9L58_010106 [Maublancomyces gigas]|uniref:Ricin B lectin domain-containing protein n=1 Tax=Discina gigas TaxID=1032678 RepID=A0ABR3G528_9PEZI
MAPPDGTYYIRNVKHNAYYLTYAQGYIVASPNNISLWDVKTSDGKTIIGQPKTLMVFDLDGGAAAEGTAILFYADKNASNQVWTLIPVGNPANSIFYIVNGMQTDRQIGMQSDLVNRDVRSHRLEEAEENQWKFVLWEPVQ